MSWFRDWRELLDSGVCDAVILTVPHFRHHEIAIAALEKNIHVLCEKPAGVRASDVQRMLEAEKRSRAKLGMFLQQRTIPLFSAIKGIVSSGAPTGSSTPIGARTATMPPLPGGAPGRGRAAASW